MTTETWLLAALFISGCSPGGPTPPPPVETPPTCDALAQSVPSEGWSHVTEGTDIVYAHNPPASGAHYPRWLPYQRFDRPARRENWVHNLEHGGIVLLYRPDAPQDVIDTLKSAFDDAPIDTACGHARTLLTPDPELVENVAAVGALRVMASDRLTRDRIHDFIRACRGRGPEDVCGGGDADAP